jgi:murein L,D-transpeptidase YafK
MHIIFNFDFVRRYIIQLIMRNLTLLLIFCCLSCQPRAQENKTFSGNNKNRDVAESGLDKPDLVKIDSIPDIKKGTDERSPAFIKKRLEALVGNFLKVKCIENSIIYPPKFVLFRCFKLEKEFEVWAGNSVKDSLRRILLLKVCAVDDIPGTKLQEGDGKTPEGFYNSEILYGSSYDFMWIKLNNNDIDKYGSANQGSSFKICLDYPNSIEKQRTKSLLKTKSPGSAICIHGNCVTAGCISFENRNFLPVFLTALWHDSKSYGSVKVHIFPFRFNQISDKDKELFAEKSGNITKEHVLGIWRNLEEAYYLFEKNRKALKVEISKNQKYVFNTF